MYLLAANITDSESEEYIFRAIMCESSSKLQNLSADRNKAMSYSTVNSIFLHKLIELG